MRKFLLNASGIVAITVTILLPLQAVAQRETRELQPRAKQSWEWTDEERVTERFSPNAIAARNAAYHAAEKARGRATANAISERSDGKLEYVIEGRRNPELFMPYELFDMLVAGVDPRAEYAAKAHTELDPGILRLGLDPTAFWNQLNRVAGPYMAARIAGEQGASPCDRHKALMAADHAVGHETLYRVLYIVVAPTTIYASVTDSKNPGKDLLEIERGCGQ